MLEDAFTDRLAAPPLVLPAWDAAAAAAWPAAAAAGAAAGGGGAGGGGGVPAPACLWVCLRFDPMHAGRTVDREPPASASSAASSATGLGFAELWGPSVAQQRRFAGAAPPLARPFSSSLPPLTHESSSSPLPPPPDGSVCRAVVWSAERLGGRQHARHAIAPLIVAHIARLHLRALMPAAILHAGDALCVAAPPASAAAPTAALLAAADVTAACPSLGLERLLDSGGACETYEARVTALPSSNGGGSEVAVARAPGAAPPAAALPAALVPLCDPLALGPFHAFATAIGAFDALAAAVR